MTREELLRSKQFGISQMKYTLLNLIGRYKERKKLKDKDIAEKLGVSKSYISQIMNGTFDHKMSKVGEIANACNAIPVLSFVDIDEYIKNDKRGYTYVLIPSPQLNNVTYKESPIIISKEPKKYIPKKLSTNERQFSKTNITSTTFTVQ